MGFGWSPPDARHWMRAGTQDRGQRPHGDPHPSGHWGFCFMVPLRFYEDATEEEIRPCIMFIEANHLTGMPLGGSKIAAAP
jgi:hypothetical protein